MNTPVWVVAAVAAFGGVQWLVRFLRLLFALNAADAEQLRIARSMLARERRKAAPPPGEGSRARASRGKAVS